MSDLLHIATRKGLFTLAPDNGSWRIANSAFLGDNCTMVLDDPRDGTLYAALGHGHFGVKLHRSTDRGRSWEEIATPAYPPMPEGYTPGKHPVFGTVIEWKLVMTWALEAGGADQPGRLWCGTLPGGLFRSDDGGASWNMIEPLWYNEKREGWFGGGYPQPGIHSIAVNPENSRHITIAISCGGVWQSTDDGQSWQQHRGGMRSEYMPPEQAYEPNSQDPHRLVACPANYNRMWVQHHNGIFRSDDAGMNWTEHKDVAPSTFGFAAAVHPADPDIAWFAPGIKDEKRIPVDGRLVVTRTRDGGKSFEQLGRGLPDANAYHLIFRHCLEADSTGDRLAMGTTTGSLFTSDDQGDHWQRITADLPPIHAVRFAKAP